MRGIGAAPKPSHKVYCASFGKGSPPEIVSRFKGALSVRGGRGVSTLARMVWGT